MSRGSVVNHLLRRFGTSVPLRDGSDLRAADAAAQISSSCFSSALMFSSQTLRPLLLIKEKSSALLRGISSSLLILRALMADAGDQVENLQISRAKALAKEM